MPNAGRTFRVYVSSTFADLVEERNALARHVFPRLTELADSQGYQFQAIDLRWGVRDEAALDQQTMNICLRELQRCQDVSPWLNFLVLLGDRYGWRPLPSQVDAEEFETIAKDVRGAERELLTGWYRRDDNAAPPQYVLRPRNPNDPDEAQPKSWERIEKHLRGVLLRAIRAQDWPDGDPRLLKYEASATHQEVELGALESAGADSQVFCFFRTIGGSPAAGEGLQNFFDVDEHGVPDTDAQKRLDRLKAELQTALPQNVVDVPAVWSGAGCSPAHIKSFCQRVYRRLAKAIRSQSKRTHTQTLLEREIERHKAFAAERRRIFIGRRTCLETIAEYLSGSANHLLIVYGESGSGKSALMAKAIEGPGAASGGQAVIVQRFVGATAESSGAQSLIESLCREILLEYGVPTPDLPIEWEELVNEFARCLGLAQPSRRLIVFLDGVDQLATESQSILAWLPSQLPPDVRLIVSVLAGDDLKSMRSVLAPESFLPVDSLLPEEAGQMLDAWLRDAHRILTPHQHKCVLQSSLTPLHLKLSFERARRWNSFTPEDETRLHETIPEAIEDLFSSLSAPANHGLLLVERSIGCLAAARYGLSENELLELLSGDADVIRDFKERSHHQPPDEKLPVVMWSRLSLDLAPYLAERSSRGGALLGFFHRQLAEIARRVFLTSDRHLALAAFFGAQDCWSGMANARALNFRKAEELPFQQHAAGMKDALRDTLLDVEFLDLKCRAGMTVDLVADYRYLDEEGAVRAVEDSVRLSAHVLHNDPGQLGSQLVGRLLDSSDPDLVKICSQVRRIAREPRLEPLLSAQRRPGDPLLRTLTGHTAPLSALAATSDGRLAVSGDDQGHVMLWDLASGRRLQTMPRGEGRTWSIAMTEDGERAVVVFAAGKVVLWNFVTRSTERQFQEEEGLEVRSVCLTPDGQRAVLGSQGGIRIWNLRTGETRRSAAGRSAYIWHVHVHPQGDRSVSASEDGSIVLWDLENLEIVRTFSGHSRGAYSARITADGRRVVSLGADSMIRIWDLESDRPFQEFGAGIFGQALEALPDGSRVIAGGDDGLSIWDLSNGSKLQAVGAGGFVRAIVTIGRTGRVISASDDGAVRLWDFSRRQIEGKIRKHDGDVFGIVFSHDAARMATASQDRTVRVWSVPSGDPGAAYEEHQSPVRAVALDPQAATAVSGDSRGEIRIWDIDTAKTLGAVQAHRPAIAGQRSDNEVKVVIQSGGIATIAFSETGEKLISTGTDGMVMIWDWKQKTAVGGVPLAASEEQGIDPWVFAVTSDANQIIAASENNPLKRLDLVQNRLNTMSIRPDSAPTAVAVTAKGGYAMCAYADGSLLLWDLLQAQHYSMMPATIKGAVGVYDPDAGRRRITGRSGHVTGVAIATNRTRAVSVAANGQVILWELEGLQQLAQFWCDTGLSCCAITGDATMIGAAGPAGLYLFQVCGA